VNPAGDSRPLWSPHRLQPPGRGRTFARAPSPHDLERV